MSKRFLVEAWSGMECIAFRRVSRPATVKTTSDHYITDLGADRIYVRWEGDIRGMAADWAHTGGWKRIDDPALRAVLGGQGMTPTKVQRIVREIERVEFMPWQNITAEPSKLNSNLWVISAERPGNVFTAESLRLYIAVHPARVIPGTDIKMRANQRFQGGYLHRFGASVDIHGWNDLHKIR